MHIAELVKLTLLNSLAISYFINKHIFALDANAVKRTLDWQYSIQSLNEGHHSCMALYCIYPNSEV